MSVLFRVLFLVSCSLCSASLFLTLGSAVFPLSRLGRTKIQPTDANQPLHLRKLYGKLCIQRNDGQTVYISDDGVNVSIQEAKTSSVRPVDPYTIPSEGIFGIYKLPAGSYLAVIKQTQALPDIPIPGLKRIRSIELVKIPTTDSSHHSKHNVNQTQLDTDQRQAELTLSSAFKQHTFYFCNSGYDLTRTYQSNMLGSVGRADNSHILGTQHTPTIHTTHTTHSTHTTPTKHHPTTDWSNIEEKYCWNLNPLSAFLDVHCTTLLTPVVNAFIDTTNITHNKKEYRLTLISRRSRRRQGPRYIKRGSDELGDVANFVETEQVLQRADGTGSSSFVQLRGSVPLFWTQPSAWKLRPPVFLGMGLDMGSGGGSSSVGVHPSALRSMVLQGCALRTHLCDIVNSYFVPLWGSSGGGGSKSSSTVNKTPHLSTVSPTNSTKRRALAANATPTSYPTSTRNAVYMINLIDKKGVQGRLGALWLRATRSVGNSRGSGSSGIYRDTQVYPRYGYYYDTTNNHSGDVPTTNNNTTDAASVDSTTTTDATLLDRNTTTHFCTTLNVSLQDMLALHYTRNRSGAVDKHESIHGTHTTPSDAHTTPIDTHLIWFDYHHKCKRNSDATTDIYHIIHSAIQSGVGYGVYLHNTTTPPTTPTPTNTTTPSTRIIHTQQHIIRTNCMDCLDRTNVMQSVVSRWVLLRQLASLGHICSSNSAYSGDVDKLASNNSTSGVIGADKTDTPYTAAQLKADQSRAMKLPDKRMESEFRRLWTENGDHLSVMYAGSRAMKRDVTRGGRRTQRGAVDDAVAGARRYFMNNLRDQERQLGVDILLGLGEYGVLSNGSGGGSSSGSRSGSVMPGADNSDSVGNTQAGRVLHQYAPWMYRLGHIKRLLSNTVLNPPPAHITTTTTATKPTTTGTKPIASRTAVRLTKRSTLAKLTPTVVSTNTNAALTRNTTTTSSTTAHTSATTTATTTPAFKEGEGTLHMQSRRLDSLLHSWLLEIPPPTLSPTLFPPVSPEPLNKHKKNTTFTGNSTTKPTEPTGQVKVSKTYHINVLERDYSTKKAQNHKLSLTQTPNKRYNHQQQQATVVSKVQKQNVLQKLTKVFLSTYLLVYRTIVLFAR